MEDKEKKHCETCNCDMELYKICREINILDYCYEIYELWKCPKCGLQVAYYQ